MTPPPIRILALSPAQAFCAACRASHRLPAVPTGRASSLPGRPILSRIRPTDQPSRSPGTLAHRVLRETLIAFPARFPRPSSSVSNQAGGWPEANPIDSAIAPTAGRQTYQRAARPTASAEGSRHCQRTIFFAPSRYTASTCQNGKWPPEGRIRCSADYCFRHHT